MHQNLEVVMKKSLLLSMILAVTFSASAQTYDRFREILPQVDLIFSMTVRETLGPKVIKEEPVQLTDFRFLDHAFAIGTKTILLNDGRHCDIIATANITFDKLGKPFLEDLVLSRADGNFEFRNSVSCFKGEEIVDSRDIFESLKKFLYVGTR